MQEIKPQTFRPWRVLLTICAGMLILGVGTALYHPLMVWLNHGTWCVQIKPEGTTLIKYGAKDCGM